MGKLHLGVYADLENIQGHSIIEQNGLRDVEQFEQAAGRSVESIMWYPTWDRPGSPGNFPRQAADLVTAHGAIPHLVWEICHPGESPLQSSISLSDIVKGRYDGYLRRYAAQIAAWKHPLFIRILHEFNGTWYSWSGPKNNRDTALFRAAWVHVVSLFRSEGASNVAWVWSPNVIGGGTPDADGWNAIRNYWPGEEFVNWIGLDGYNFFPYFEGEQPLLSTEALFRRTYDECCALTPTTPFMLAEFASGEYHAPNQPLPNKALWIRDCFETLNSTFQRLEWIFWFNVKKEKDWRIDSSPAALQAFREGLQSPAFSARSSV